MINKELLDYIKNAIAQGKSEEVIKESLRGAGGWSDDDLKEAFKAVTPKIAPLNSPIPQAPAVPFSTPSYVPPIITPNPAQTFENIQEKSTYPHSSKIKKIILAILILVLLLLLSGGAYAYFSGTFVSLPELASRAIDNARATNTATYDTTISIDTSELKDVMSGMNELFSGDIALNKFIFTTKGSYDFTDIKNKKFSSLISINADALSTTIDLRIVDGTLYGKLVKAPVVVFLPVLKEYENKWFSVSSELGNDNELLSQVPFASFIGVDPDIIKELSPEQKEYLYQISRDAHFIKIVKKFPPEIINDTLSYHFLFDFDKEGIATYFSLLKEYVNSIGKDDSYLSSFDPSSFITNLDKLKDFKGEIWIGRKNKLPYKIILNFSIKIDENKPEEVKVNMVSIFNNWNQPVSIITPTDSIPFQTLIEGSLGVARTKGQTAAIKANLANLRATAEIFYDNHKGVYLGFCQSKELKDVHKSIEDLNGTGLVCKDKTTAFAVAAKLADNLGYWCVDSTGVSKEIVATLTGTVCPVK
jgi:hypothetical protein